MTNVVKATCGNLLDQQTTMVYKAGRDRAVVPRFVGFNVAMPRSQAVLRNTEGSQDRIRLRLKAVPLTVEHPSAYG